MSADQPEREMTAWERVKYRVWHWWAFDQWVGAVTHIAAFVLGIVVGVLYVA